MVVCRGSGGGGGVLMDSFEISGREPTRGIKTGEKNDLEGDGMNVLSNTSRRRLDALLQVWRQGEASHWCKAGETH